MVMCQQAGETFAEVRIHRSLDPQGFTRQWVQKFENLGLEKHPRARAEDLAEFVAACLPGVAEVPNNRQTRF